MHKEGIYCVWQRCTIVPFFLTCFIRSDHWEWLENNSFWDWIVGHYNHNHLVGLVTRLARSLESKWGIIKHHVVKFIGDHSIVQALQKCETSTKDTI